MFDIAQAAIGMDGSGPVEFIPKGYEGTEYATMKYANGIVMTEQPYREDNANAQGIKFIGDKGVESRSRLYRMFRSFLVAERGKKSGRENMK